MSEPPGSDDICPICFWQDDLVQLRYPSTPGGANRVSLIEGQVNFSEYGACERLLLNFVREVTQEDDLDQGWRLIDLQIDEFESESIKNWPDDMTRLYWWR